MELSEWTRAHCGCMICGSRPADPHHVRSRGAGHGDWVKKNGNVVPLCRRHHTEVHQGGPEKFRAKHEVNLGLRAVQQGIKYATWRAGVFRLVSTDTEA